jgi:3',5'-cyclic AMP phosphodiesterase CpdA
MSNPKPSVFNLCWWTKRPGSKNNPLVISRHNTSTIGKHKPIGVVILYPALATPEILIGDDDLEILLLTQSSYPKERLRMRIRDQLRIAHGLGASKTISEDGLFVNPPGKKLFEEKDREIKITPLSFSDGTLLQTDSKRFSGYMDTRAYGMFTNAGYTNLYSITVSNKVLQDGNSGAQHSACGEPHDELIQKLLDRHNKWAWQHGEYFCFQDRSNDLDYTTFNTQDPIQSYHPVYYYPNKDFYFNVAHHSDIHIAARQQVLKKTKARVIDYTDTSGESCLEYSPYIGTRVNVCSVEMKTILDKIGRSAADLLIIGGDLVDYIRSFYPDPEIMKAVESGKPAEVWDAVDLGSRYQNRYRHGVDLIAFYTILIGFLRKYPLPAFAITGNHDCYFEPYGISPRWHGFLTNKGIPADHNLTSYEAILAFGRTNAAILTGTDTSFRAEYFDWFYTVFTPFSDYSVELPEQELVAFGWGDHEDFLDKAGGQFGGHLPRAVDSISANQFNLLKRSVEKGKRIVLATHFTFVSYDDKLPIKDGERKLGTIYCSSVKNYNDCNLGTFQLRRKEVLAGPCANRQIQVILTGHSHRHALYVVDTHDSGTFERESLTVRHLEFKDCQKYPNLSQPAIIVSDSGGTIPRYNYNGEFAAWGSAPPSGTVVEFGADGTLQSVKAQRSSCRPRAVAALDFSFVVGGKKLWTLFESDPLPINADRNGKRNVLTFTIVLNDKEDLNNKEKDMSWLKGVAVTSLSFFSNYAPGQWSRIELLSLGGNAFQVTNKTDVQAFVHYFVDNRERTNFLSMKLSKPDGFPNPNSSFDDHWSWEFQVASKLSGQNWLPWAPAEKKYLIQRKKDFADVPDFDTRAKYNAAKYAKGGNA